MKVAKLGSVGDLGKNAWMAGYFIIKETEGLDLDSIWQKRMNIAKELYKCSNCETKELLKKLKKEIAPRKPLLGF
jgi:hypothetical protein